MKFLNVRQPLGFIGLSDTINNYVLIGGTAVTFTIPAGATNAIVNSENGKLWLKMGSASLTDIAVPSANVTNGTGVMLDPVGLDLGGVEKISIISAADQKVSITYFKNTL